MGKYFNMVYLKSLQANFMTNASLVRILANEGKSTET